MIKALRILLLLQFGFLARMTDAQAQCPTATFTVPATACRDQSIQPVFSPTPDMRSFQWDFCQGELSASPALGVARAITAVTDALDIKAVDENSNHYVFIISRGGAASSNMLRVQMNAANTDTLSVTSLGSFKPFVKPTGLALWQEGTQKYAVITYSDGNIIRADFGTSWANPPTANTVGGMSSLVGASNLRHIKLIKVRGRVIAFITNAGYDKVMMLDFGSSVTGVPTIRSIAVPPGGVLTGIDAIRYCNNTYVVTSDYIKGLYVLNFGTDIDSAPTITKITTQTNLLGISVEQTGGNFYIFGTSDNAGLHRFECGNAIDNTSPVHTVLGTFGNLNNAWAFHLQRQGSHHYGFFINNSGNVFTAIDFPKACSINANFAGNATPTASYTASGSYQVNLDAVDTAGNVFSKQQAVTISAQQSPDIDFTATSTCTGQSAGFTATNVSGNINTWAWTFGDGQNSADATSTTHVYAAKGDYNPTLQVTASNGCTNSVTRALHIFTRPVPDFTLPAAVFCTQQDYVFANTTTKDNDMTVTWEWRLGGTLISTDQQLLQRFNDPFSVATNVQLDVISAAPGCSNSVTRSIAAVYTGPAVDFGVNGSCVGATFTFTNQTVGDVQNYQWTFSDAVTSKATDTTRVFNQAGLVDVTLRATNAQGCLNEKTKSVQVFSKPAPAFTLDLPPFSCAGTASQFHDATPSLTDSNIIAWAWHFGDASPQSGSGKQPTHVYDAAGDYQVSLSVITSAGCAASVLQPVTISPSPVANFSVSSACASQAAHFTDASTGTIASWQWTIAAGQYNLQNPVHVFASAGSYPVQLIVTGSNGCVALTSRAVVVPEVPSLNFTTPQACAGQAVNIQDRTVSLNDPVTTQAWTFSDGGNGQGQQIDHVFAQAGNYDVSLAATTTSGCSYALSKKIVVQPTPHAAFTPSLETGGAPLDVTFTNESTGATQYRWNFGDAAATTSVLASPAFTYTELGDYLVQLTAVAASGCADSTSTAVHVLIPRLDAAITALHLVPDRVTGTVAAVFLLTNHSNVVMRKAALLADMAGKTQLRNTLDVNLKPGESSLESLPYNISLSGLQYLCVTLELDKDIALQDNEVCLTPNAEPFINPPYPNPASDTFTLNFFVPQDAEATVTVWRADGLLVAQRRQLLLAEGLTSLKWDVTDWSSGLYQISVRGTFGEQRFMVLVNH